MVLKEMEEAIIMLTVAADSEEMSSLLENRILGDASNPYEFADDTFLMLFRISNVRYICDSV